MKRNAQMHGWRIEVLSGDPTFFFPSLFDIIARSLLSICINNFHPIFSTINYQISIFSNKLKQIPKKEFVHEKL